ncbi:MAG: hypothetical protein K2P81_05605 [Bacteriovoracaceae bacterium]|nr:hypothetical protein [Bacteriovoracaceae bacterium]
MWVGLLFLILMIERTEAHPTYIRLGYASCTGCHMSSQGGGLLTPYGQGIATTQSLISSEPSEDEGEKKYIQAFQGRVLRLQEVEETRTFPMQMDYLAQYKISENLRVEGILAVAPKPKDVAPEDAKPAHKRLYARSLLLSWVNKQQRMSLGISSLPIGLGLIDHTSYVRANNRNQVTDLPLLIKHYFESLKFQSHTFLYAANPNEEKGNQENGVGSQIWFKPIRHIALGFQGLSGNSPSIKRDLVGFLLKAGYGKFSYLAEVDRTWREIKEDKTEFRQWTWYQQLSFYPAEFLHLFTSWQGLEKDRAFLSRESRIALGAEIRLTKNLTFSFEDRVRKTGSINDEIKLFQLYLNWW